LLRQVDAVLQKAGITLPEIELFAAAIGPGSFTGLRIGLATVKSFAATLSRPCVAIPTLHAVAHAAGISSHTLAMLQAGRGEVFAQLLSVDEDDSVHASNEPAHLNPQLLIEKFKHLRKLKWAGEAARQNSDLIREAAHMAGLAFIDEAQPEGMMQERVGEVWTLAAPFETLAEDVACLAHQNALRGETCQAEELSALYVRPSDAELNEQCLG
jgi:tRNA threonylcarbamoyladenosine biosynthesis protein TsaB